VLAEVVGLPALTWGRLHTDPAPEAFLHDAASGVTGLIDWAGACPGPLLYDVASAVMYLGGVSAAEPFLAAYLPVSPLRELAHLPTWLRYRGAVQASYFADRILRADLTGTDPAGNRRGLAHGRAMMSQPGGAVGR
jgi:homoserine kinase type II